MSQIDETQAVTQESLEPQSTEPQYTVKMEGYDPPQTQTNETTEQPTTTGVDEGGVAELIEDASAPPQQEEVQQEKSVVEEEIIDLNAQEEAPVGLTSDVPEWVEKLVKFNQETGGGLEEYQRLNKDYESLNDIQVLQEYYKHVKPGYTPEDIDLLLDSKFSVAEVEEGEDMTRDDKLKLLALKDEVATAKGYLNQNKDKYYADLKSGVHGAPEQYKEAVDFYSNYQKQSESQKKVRETFVKKSKEIFNESFTGFPFESGDKSYRIKIGDGQAVMNQQLDMNNIVGKFLDEGGNIVDVAGWHKALWSAQNPDKLFNAGVEAGKAQALKERAQATKNPSYVSEGPSKPPTQKGTVRFLGTDNNY